ncbi:MAG: PorV/PorQ family protein [candidate division Zixibacteria bacterium]|nr:PorV/PorQ family protein [candidate division Zixibacteria bacterium]
MHLNLKRGNTVRKLVLFSAILIAGVAITARADNENAGKSAYSFLKVGVSARAQAMGGAMVALADDEYSAFYNPAGLGRLVPITEVEDQYGDWHEVEGDIDNFFAASYNNYVADIQSGYLTYIKRQGYSGMLGFAVDYFNYGSFDRTDANNAHLGTFTASDIAIGATYGQRASKNLYWGLTAKFIYQKLEDYSSDGAALDAGIIYILGDDRTSIGLSARNIGVQLKGLTENHKDPLPTSVHAGVAHALQGLPVNFSGQVDYPFDYDISFKAGVEFTGIDPLFLRAGWDSSGKDYETGSSRDNLGGFSGGFGYAWKNYHFDYSYSSFADLGNSHRISISGGF